MSPAPGSQGRVVAVAPDPVEIARRLADRPGLVALVSRPVGAPRPDDTRYSFVACDPTARSEHLVPGPYDASGSDDPIPHWLGVVPYEALREGERPGWSPSPDGRAAAALARPTWRRYPAIVRVDHATGDVRVVGTDAGAVAVLAERLTGAPLAARAWSLRVLPADEPDEAHLGRVREALDLIAAGDLYEINVARRLRLSFQGDALALFTRLLDLAPAPWSYFHDLGEHLVLATSPELALSVQGDRLRTCPIKGTRPRGRDAVEDARWADELARHPKERAELTMAVDVHRNDLGRVAVPGSVEVRGEPELLRGGTVWSRCAEVVAVRRADATLSDVARAVLPCGSVTGAPKVRAMEVIARLEPWRRGLYTGVVGWAGDGRLELAMAIRTMQLSRAGAGWEGDYFTGGGIVADSVPELELEETRWKASQLARLADECASSAGA